MSQKRESKIYPEYYEYKLPFDPTIGMDVFSEIENAPEIEDVDEEFKKLNCYNGEIKIMNRDVDFPYTQDQLDEMERCYDDILYFIVNYCKIITMSDGLQLFKMFQYQRNTIKVIHENRFSIFKFPRQMGKNLAWDTPILTTRGFKMMEDIKVGDFIFGDDGKPTEVTFKTDPIYEKCYKITFDNGEEIIAGANHDWKFYDSSKEKYVVGNTEHMNERLKVIHRQKKGMFIDHAACVEFPYNDVEIDPYELGLWLGDGHSCSTKLTASKIDHDHYESNTNLMEYVGRKNRGHVGDRKFKDWGLTELKLYNLYKNKHIPNDYIYNSKEVRIKLLQGLMDTDGSIEKNGVCRFYQSNLKIIEDFRLLLSTLGIKSTMYSKQPTMENAKLAYTVCFVCNEFDVCTLPRKLDRQYANSSHPKSKRLYIHSIKEVPTEASYCITVNNESHLFLCGRSLVPTHNCSTKDTNITVRINGEELDLTIGQLYDLIEHENVVESYVPNYTYQILTEDGFKDFDGITTRTVDELYEIILSNDSKIRATAKHEIKLFDGQFIKMSDLKVGDVVGVEEKNIITNINVYKGEYRVADMISVKDTHSFAVNDLSAILSNCIDGDSLVTMLDNHTGKIFQIHVDKLFDYLYAGAKHDITDQ